MNSGNSDPHRLLPNLSDEINLKKSDKYVALSNLSIYYTWENIKTLIATINFRNQLQSGMINLNYLTNHILYQIFKIFLSISSKNMNQ